MTDQNFIVATAGHVDHGKSALVKALSGVDPDRLPEEKERGLTIDLGFAFLEIPSPDDPSIVFQLGIVDVPGHEDFVKNMVAGVGSIDLTILVIAADDGWMPQTEEHLQILSYLGVTCGVVAITKSDLLEEHETAKIKEIEERLSKSRLRNAPVIRTSTVTGEGIAELKNALGRVLKDAPKPRPSGKPRLPVDRVFSMQGIGTVATGTLTGGKLRQGQKVLIQPSGIESRIRNIQSQNQNLEESRPSMRTAASLSHVSTSASQITARIQRGDVVTLPEFGDPSLTADALVERSQKSDESLLGEDRPLADGSRVRVHHGTGNAPARLQFFEKRDLLLGKSALAQLRLESPLFLFAGDRFIIRDWPEQTTLAGGVILDPQSGSSLLRNRAQKDFLEARARSPEDVDQWINAQVERDLTVSPSGILIQSNFSAGQIAQSIQRLADSEHAILIGQLLVERSWWEELCKHAADAIDQEHREHPERSGLTLSGLRRIACSENLRPGVFEALVESLNQSGFEKQGIFLKRSAHQVALPDRLKPLADRIRSNLNHKPLEPPSRKELGTDSASKEALAFLIESGEAVEISDKIVMSKSSLDLARTKIVDFLRSKGPATVSEIRLALGTSRRIAVPLLEKFDRDGFTLRDGDRRALRRP